MKDYTVWLKNYFLMRATLPTNVEEKNYFEAGLIDSLGVIELIESIETEFNLKFTEENFQDRRFSTINGLAAIIQQIKQE